MKQTPTPAHAPQTTPAPKPKHTQAEVPQPTHGGVYEHVSGKLHVIEGGPDKHYPHHKKPEPASSGAAEGESA